MPFWTILGKIEATIVFPESSYFNREVFAMETKREFRFVITPFCNYRCFFCHHEGVTEEHTPLLLSTNDYEFIAEVGREFLGWDSVTITGGEPLISPHYRKICERLDAKGIRITTVTNGSLISNPKEILKHNRQLNVSIHSLDPNTYAGIAGTNYPVERVMGTLVATRLALPELEIHLNATVIRGMNDDLGSMERLIEFAHLIDARAKFIDLAGHDDLNVPFEEIVGNLNALGFQMTDKSPWQVEMAKGEQVVGLSRCGFNESYSGIKTRDVFVNPNGVLNSSTCDARVDALPEIRKRDANMFASKVRWILQA